MIVWELIFFKKQNNTQRLLVCARLCCHNKPPSKSHSFCNNDSLFLTFVLYCQQWVICNWDSCAFSHQDPGRSSRSCLRPTIFAAKKRVTGLMVSYDSWSFCSNVIDQELFMSSMAMEWGTAFLTRENNTD